jgi:hypothetical protein
LNLAGKKKQEEMEDCIQRKFRTFLLIKCYSVDLIKVNAMGGYVTLIGGKKKCIYSFCGEA